MPDTPRRLALAAAALWTAGLLALPTVTLAQLGGLLPTPNTSTSTIQGSAAAVEASVLGVTATLAGTGPLNGANQSLDASSTTATVPSLVTGEVLHAVTISWQDEVDSEAAIANLGVTAGEVTLTADSVLAQASSVLGSASSGSSTISGLSVNGAPIAITGAPNQTIAILGGQLIINEQSVSPSGITVNALHLILPGADVVIGTATSSIS